MCSSDLMTEALRESESQLRLLIDNMREGMVLLGPDHHILRTNPAFASMFGYADALLPGMPIAPLLPGIPELNAVDESLGAPLHQ